MVGGTGGAHGITPTAGPKGLESAAPMDVETLRQLFPLWSEDDLRVVTSESAGMGESGPTVGGLSASVV